MIQPKIVPVPEKMQKFYGSGQMLHPEMNMLLELLEIIPRGKVTTIEILAKQLSTIYGTDVTCPMRTGNLLKRLSKTTDANVPFWRVIKKDHHMIKLDKYEYWATVLEEEGFLLRFTNKNQLKVLVLEDQFFRFKELIE